MIDSKSSSAIIQTTGTPLRVTRTRWWVATASSTSAEKFCRASATGTVVMYRILAHWLATGERQSIPAAARERRATSMRRPCPPGWHRRCRAEDQDTFSLVRRHEMRNGIGKTTTVEILEGYRDRDGGEVWVLGQDPATAGGAWRDRVGVAGRVRSVAGCPAASGAGGRISTSVYYVPGIIALGVIAACFTSLAASVTAQRERGVLKRRRATPVPAAAVIAGRVLTAVVIAVVMTAVLLGIGWAAYGARVPGRTAVALAVTVVTGAAAASFGCLGYALTSLIRTEDAAQPVTQALLLPLYFISGLFVAVPVLPPWLAAVGEIFPFAGPDLLIVAAWGAAGLLIALRTFSWLPLGR